MKLFRTRKKWNMGEWNATVWVRKTPVYLWFEGTFHRQSVEQSFFFVTEKLTTHIGSKGEMPRDNGASDDI